VGALGITEYKDAIALRLDAEREECEWLLTSGALGRSGNLTRVLRYVCEEYFQGRADQIKEYTIAVGALGRRTEFDPQTDTIVRVTVHALRKRLMEIYQNEGAGRAVRLILPPGHYAPSFVHQPSADRRPILRLPEESSQSAEIAPDRILVMEDRPDLPRRAFRSSAQTSIRYLVALAVAAAAIAVAVWWSGRAAKRTRPVYAPMVSSALPLPAPQPAIHALMGKNRAAYVDRSGVTWTGGNYCHSGTSVNLPSQRIEGTEDAPLYLGGVRGLVHCVFPVPQGLYELHLDFADTSYAATSDLPMSAREASITINSGAAQYLRVVDEAGGYDIATSVVVTGVARENDGSIHLDYVSEVSLLSAVEILPTQSAKQLPIRILASSRAFIDDAKQEWGSDRYFSGGRHGQELKLANVSNLGIYQSSRVGRFRYNIPAVPLAHYRVRLYFREPWFGKDNGGIGGPGSRVFDVVCNGDLLMKSFDILAEGDSKPVVKTFENVQASADGRIELYFMPVVNYAAVNAIEILPED
jgi:hypothetical protein